MLMTSGCPMRLARRSGRRRPEVCTSTSGSGVAGDRGVRVQCRLLVERVARVQRDRRRRRRSSERRGRPTMIADHRPTRTAATASEPNSRRLRTLTGRQAIGGPPPAIVGGNRWQRACRARSGGREALPQTGELGASVASGNEVRRDRDLVDDHVRAGVLRWTAAWTLVERRHDRSRPARRPTHPTARPARPLPPGNLSASVHLLQMALARAVSSGTSEKNRWVSVPWPSAQRGRGARTAIGSMSSSNGVSMSMGFGVGVDAYMFGCSFSDGGSGEKPERPPGSCDPDGLGAVLPTCGYVGCFPRRRAGRLVAEIGS